jgi:Bacterial self-protective colicin-like immunity
VVDDDPDLPASGQRRFALYCEQVSQFLSGRIMARTFVDSVLRLWREDRGAAWAERRGAPAGDAHGLTPEEFERVEALFFLVDDFDEEADIYEQFIGESELRSRLRRAHWAS